MMKKVPKRRFKGFLNAGDWEQRKFSELFEYERPDAYIVQSDLYCDEYNVPVLTANKAFILGYTNEECTYNKPSIIFDDFTLDRKYVDFPYMLKSSAIKILTAKEHHNLRFLFERLNSTRFVVLGHARHYISVVQNTSTLCPTLDEENCISTILTKVDTLITLHQRKLEKLQATKKALLYELFPIENNRRPKRRFKGFTGDWEQRKLGDVADVKDGTHDSPKFYNDGFPLVTSKNLKDGSIDFSDCSFISEQDFNEINKRSKVDRGDILFGMIGTIGNPAIVEHNGFAIKNVALIKEGKIINNRFIYHLLSSKVFENYIARENAGGTQKFIALNQIRSFNFLAPALVEQNKIIELLDYISQSITLHQRKLEKLKNLKAAYLNEMFV